MSYIVYILWTLLSCLVVWCWLMILLHWLVGPPRLKADWRFWASLRNCPSIHEKYRTDGLPTVTIDDWHTQIIALIIQKNLEVIADTRHCLWRPNVTEQVEHPWIHPPYHFPPSYIQAMFHDFAKHAMLHKNLIWNPGVGLLSTAVPDGNIQSAIKSHK